MYVCICDNCHQTFIGRIRRRLISAAAAELGSLSCYYCTYIPHMYIDACGMGSVMSSFTRAGEVGAYSRYRHRESIVFGAK